MRNCLLRLSLVVLVAFYVQPTSSESSSDQCLECPADEHVGGSRSCESTDPTYRHKWIVGGWIEFPVVDWTCEDSGECEAGECAQCSAFVEVRLYVVCKSEVDHRAPVGYGFPLDYADPLFDFSLIDYFAPAGEIYN